MSSDLTPNQALVSVIIPAHNAEAFIRETLRSVLTQTYTNIEVLVVDDGSCDRTAAIVEDVMQRDQRVTLLKQTHAGVAAARNLAIQQAKGEYIAPIDADDLWFPQNLEKQVQVMQQADASIGLVYSWSLDIDETGSFTGGFHNSTLEGDVYTTLACKYFLGNASCTLMRRSCLEKIGGYDTQMRAENAQGCEDWDLNLRIAQHFQFRVVPEFLVGYRQITSSMSCNYTAMANSHALVLRKLYHRNSELSPDIGQWSRSNFCLYLAVKSCRGQAYQNTLSWLYQAFKHDFALALLRHDWLLLVGQSVLGLMRQSLFGSKFSSMFSFPKMFERKATPLRQQKQKQISPATIRLRMAIHRYLPAQLYERFRLKQWSQQPRWLHH